MMSYAARAGARCGCGLRSAQGTTSLATKGPRGRPFSSSEMSGHKKLWEKFWTWTTKETPVFDRWTFPWWREQALLCTVFAITGSSTLWLIRPTITRITGLEGSLKDGPWSYRIASIMIVSPCYTFNLLVLGSLAGRHKYFAAMAQKMWGRFLPKSIAQQAKCAPAKLKKPVIPTKAPPGANG
ncbi:unnamed protein product [Chrysoparadoxa australica]